MIKFLNISKKFKSNFWEKSNIALDNISFEIRAGDLVGFLGANGAGKTTLIKILMDFSRQDSGAVVFDKSLGNNLNEIKSQIGYLPERAYLYPHLTGREFLILICHLNNVDKKSMMDEIEKHAENLNIQHAIDRKISGYSKGMQQRLGFISAIIHKPKFIVLDEPLSGLDPLGRREFKKILKDLNNSGTTIFFSSHVVADVEEICNKVVFIENGKLIYEGSIDKLIFENSNTNKFIIKYMENEVVQKLEVDEKNKNLELANLLKKNANIIDLEFEKPTLEEIIYKIK